MAARSNAISELTRFWLQARHRCLVDESVAVKVFHGNSDIDLVAMRADSTSWALPSGQEITHAIIETKDEHDYDPSGKEMGKSLAADLEAMGPGRYIPKQTKKHTPAKFSMLREEHFAVAQQLFGRDDFDRLIVLHDIDKQVLNKSGEALKTRRIHVLTIREIVSDLQAWYPQAAMKAGMRHTLMGDLWHLLIGHCKLQFPSDQSAQK